MIKFYLKLAAVAALAVAFVVLFIYELVTTGTISGLTLIPVLVAVLWSAARTVKEDMKDMLQYYQEADEE